MSAETILGNLESVIASHGWAVQAASHERDGAQYSYTVGLGRFNHPEVMVLGFPHEQGHLLLNDIGAMIASGVRFGDWSCSHDLIEEHPVWFREIAPQHVEFFARMATMRSTSKNVRLLQAILPDALGRYPWNGGCDAAYRRQVEDGGLFIEYTVQ